MTVKTSKGSVTASEDVLNYISFLASRAADDYFSYGRSRSGELAQEFSDEIYVALEECGFYDN